jgi:hypothetical protein
MPNREQIHVTVSKLLTATATSTGTVTSASVDTLGFDSCAFNLHYGATAPAPTSETIEESPDNSTWGAAAAADVVTDAGTHAVSTTRRLAYIGGKRYARVVVVQSASTILTITAALGYPDKAPTANPV